MEVFSNGRASSKDSQLLLLGLQLLNKSLKLPHTIVKPSLPEPPEVRPRESGEEDSSSSHDECTPSPPMIGINRKRKLPGDMNSESEKKEKR